MNVSVTNIIDGIGADKLIPIGISYLRHLMVPSSCIEVSKSLTHQVIITTLASNLPHTNSPHVTSLKKRKLNSIPSIINRVPSSLVRVLNIKSLEISEVFLKNIHVKTTSITIFHQGFFGKLEFLLDLHQHFRVIWK